jgi:hypothetical protein
VNNSRLYIIALLLTCLGVGLFLYKSLVLQFPLTPDEESSVYTVEARFFFSARSKKSIKARLLIPRSSNRYMITDENFVSHGYGLTTSLKNGNRQALWSIRHAAGDQYLFYRAIIRKMDAEALEISTVLPSTEDSLFTGPQLVAARSLLEEIQEKSADLDTFMSELIKKLNETKQHGSVDSLLERKYTSLKKTQVAVKLLAMAGIPARSVHGVELVEESRDTEIIHWLEVLDDNLWRPFVLNNDSQELPDNYFPWWRGDISLFYIKGGENVHVNFAAKRNQEGAINIALAGGRIKNPLLFELSLFSLPIDTQGVYRILLLLPLGALLVVIARNIIGLKCFGTFMPVLIAVAFRDTKLMWGISLFALVVLFGLLIRMALEKLKLLLIPRMAVVLTSVILIVAGISVLTHKLGIERSVYVALFPMVIITMVIERMSIVWDEQGSGEALKQGLGSLLIAALVYLVITSDLIAHLVFIFPELNLLLLVIMLLLGRYTGYRLLEFHRFHQLIKDR